MRTLEAPLALALSELRPEHAPLVGGKAAGLGALLAGGFPVPDGAVLTVAATGALLSGAGAGAALDALAARLAEPAAPDEERFLSSVRERLRGARLPDAARAALRAAAGRLLGSGAALAVRSSGTLEDGVTASFAGQYESVLDVRGEAALDAAIGRCVASLFTPRVASYLRGLGAHPRSLGMAVVVQRLVPAEASGVLFSVNPLTGREEESVIEAAPGLGDALVSGRVAADRWVVVRAEPPFVAAREVAPRPARLASAAGGVAAAPAHEAALEEDAVLALADLGARVQEHLGFPVDVEWARAGGALWVLQARPITRITFAPGTGEWTTADFRDGGVSADVCPPFMWSLYERAFDTSMPAYLRALHLLPPGHEAKWTRIFFARPYWNVGEAKAAVAPLPGFVERNFDLDLGIPPAYEGPGRTTPTTVRTVLRALPVLAALHRGYRRRLRANRAFLAAFPERIRPFALDREALAALPDAALAARYRALVRDVHLETETSYFETIYNTSNAKLDFKVAFERARAAAGDLDYPTLVGGLRDLSHLRPMRDLYETVGALARTGRPVDDETVAAFASRWPQRGRKELDLRAPRWPEDLPHVSAMLSRALAAWPEADPDAASRAQHAAYERQRDRALAALRLRPLARAAFRRRLARLRAFTWWREEMRDRSSLVYALVRRFTVEVARRLAERGVLEDPKDAWYLRHEEVLAAVEGALAPTEVRRRARAGRRLVRSFRAYRNPNEIGAGHAAMPELPPPSGRVLHGTPCAPGRASGRARVARSVDEAERVERGEVLVAQFTDPGWTPLFPRLAAVVTETGGLLSHAAVIAREYGIPAVLAVEGATRAIRDGDEVRVDAVLGSVEIVAR